MFLLWGGRQRTTTTTTSTRNNVTFDSQSFPSNNLRRRCCYFFFFSFLVGARILIFFLCLSVALFVVIRHKPYMVFFVPPPHSPPSSLRLCLWRCCARLMLAPFWLYQSVMSAGSSKIVKRKGTSFTQRCKRGFSQTVCYSDLRFLLRIFSLKKGKYGVSNPSVPFLRTRLKRAIWRWGRRMQAQQALTLSVKYLYIWMSMTLPPSMDMSTGSALESSILGLKLMVRSMHSVPMIIPQVEFSKLNQDDVLGSHSAHLFLLEQLI